MWIFKKRFGSRCYYYQPKDLDSKMILSVIENKYKSFIANIVFECNIIDSKEFKNPTEAKKWIEEQYNNYFKVF